jgi:hypothetical protein
MLPPSSLSKNKPRNSVNAGGKQNCFYAGFLLGVFFDLENGDMLLRNVV